MHWTTPFSAARRQLLAAGVIALGLSSALCPAQAETPANAVYAGKVDEGSASLTLTAGGQKGQLLIQSAHCSAAVSGDITEMGRGMLLTVPADDLHPDQCHIALLARNGVVTDASEEVSCRQWHGADCDFDFSGNMARQPTR
ncbi:hypothetical protein ACTVH1_16920 [Gluconobacter cerinus]